MGAEIGSTVVWFDRVPFLVPTFDGEPLEFPFKSFDTWLRTYCGAGKFGDIFVPDTIWGLKVSPACYIHDEDFSCLPRDWKHFHVANSRFLHNIIRIIQYRSKSSFLKRLRMYRAVTYYNAVDQCGQKYFFRSQPQEVFNT